MITITDGGGAYFSVSPRHLGDCGVHMSLIEAAPAAVALATAASALYRSNTRKRARDFYVLRLTIQMREIEGEAIQGMQPVEHVEEAGCIPVGASLQI